MALQPEDVRTRILEGQARLRPLLSGLTDDVVRAPGTLPGWSRAHVLAHIGGVAASLARQAEYALRGELVDVYDGGRPGRDAAIEAGATRTAAQLATAVGEALDHAEAVWASMGPEDWTRPVRYRDGDLTTCLDSWWRELLIHTADLDLCSTPSDWPRDFCLHVLTYLAPRVPQDLRLELRATDGEEAFAHGANAGAPGVVARGRLCDLTAWIAGREPEHTLRTDGGEALPELLPWPFS